MAKEKNNLPTRSNEYFLDIDKENIPRGFKQKYVLSYVPLRDSVVKSRAAFWVENMAHDFYIYHIEEKYYKQFTRNIKIFIFSLLAIFVTLLLFLNFVATKGSWLSNAIRASHPQGYEAIMLSLFAIIIVLLAACALFFLVFSYFTSTFFNISLSRFLRSDEYKRRCQQYTTMESLFAYGNPRKVKILYKMKFITKKFFNEYKKNYNIQNALECVDNTPKATSKNIFKEFYSKYKKNAKKEK